MIELAREGEARKLAGEHSLTSRFNIQRHSANLLTPRNNSRIDHFDRIAFEQVCSLLLETYGCRLVSVIEG